MLAAPGTTERAASSRASMVTARHALAAPQAGHCCPCAADDVSGLMLMRLLAALFLPSGKRLDAIHRRVVYTIAMVLEYVHVYVQKNLCKTQMLGVTAGYGRSRFLFQSNNFTTLWSLFLQL
jgi:hypothetical protein